MVAGRDDEPGVARLRALLAGPSGSVILRERPEALPEAVELLIRRPDAIRRVLSRPGYTDPSAIDGPLDPHPIEQGLM